MEKIDKITAAVAQKWAEDDFYASNTVSLGLDIGAEGIGVAIRKGQELVYCQTLLVDLPAAKALAARRQLRAARHARKNYRRRMRRLKELFSRHNLPWVSDEVCHRSDPFLLRYRAITGTLASKEALTLCIRSCVALRGYDFFALSRDAGGEYPWGDSNALVDAEKWVRAEYVNEEMKDYLLSLSTELVFKNKELEDDSLDRWINLVNERFSCAEKEGIPAMLCQYARSHNKGSHRARGHNYPRSHVESHLREILERHKHLIDGYDAFVESLFLPCNSRKNKEAAIFHYNRKTKDEAERHYQSKVKRCPYSSWSELNLPLERCGVNGDKDIIAWKLVDFLSVRHFEFQQGKRSLMPVAGVKALWDAVQSGGSNWRSIKSRLNKALKPLSLLKIEWNTFQLEQLQNIVKPKPKLRYKRASISKAAAKKLCDVLTSAGTDFDPAHWEVLKRELGLYELRARMEGSDGGIYPQVRMLLGTLKTKAGEPMFATQGWLQRIFRQIQDKLGGKLTPDYCVVECVKDPAINKDQKQERIKENDKNKSRRKGLCARYGMEDLNRSQLLRIRLFEEQGGYMDLRDKDHKKDRPAKCPFTGVSISSPLSADLDLAHIFPNSKGGLYAAENLVLTTKKVNAEMGNYTPMEAADLGLPGWLSAEKMKQQMKEFRWNSKKQELFVFVPTKDVPFPDFNNMTRIAQLARELRHLVAIWMGIDQDVEAMRVRLGNLSGLYTAAARRSLLPESYRKDRSNHLHHRIDAAVMSCIPPSGINDVLYGGVFRNEVVKGNRSLFCISGLPLPDFDKLIHEDGEIPPVVKPRSSGKTKPLGDSTFWSEYDKGQVRQRTALTLKSPDADIQNAFPIKEKSGSLKLIAAWKSANTPSTQEEEDVPLKPLVMSNGTTLAHVYKKGGKGGIQNSPLGWSGEVTAEGKFYQLRKLKSCNDRLELWLGWNAKKKCWEYYKRIVPTRDALRGLKRMGMPWRGRRGASPWLTDLLDRQEAADLKSLICGTLPPHSVKVGVIRKGDVFLYDFKRDKKLTEESKDLIQQDKPLVLRTWGSISAIEQKKKKEKEKKMEIKCLTHKDRKKGALEKTSELAALLGLPDPREKAEELALTPPV